MHAVLLAALLPAAVPGHECHCWTGTMKGNDEVDTQLYLCRDAQGNASGWLDWQGKASGRNIRAVAGTWRGAVLELRDTRFLLDAPRSGWRFCAIDLYTLQVSKKTGAAGGEYVSKACRDKARIDFVAAPVGACKKAEAEVEAIRAAEAPPGT